MTVMHNYVDRTQAPLVSAATPEDEQRAIADFLDRETEKIDSLVAKKQRLIELLREKRTAAHRPRRYQGPQPRCADEGLRHGVVRRDSGALAVVRLGYFARVLNRVDSFTRRRCVLASTAPSHG